MSPQTWLVPATLFVGLIPACASNRKADAGDPSSGGPSGSPGAVTASGAATASPTLAASTPPPAGKGPGQGVPCEDGNCAPGLTCVVYYGIAGPAGPKFTSCEMKCSATGKPGCPAGQNCVTIADGPGTVCRPSGS